MKPEAPFIKCSVILTVAVIIIASGAYDSRKAISLAQTPRQRDLELRRTNQLNKLPVNSKRFAVIIGVDDYEEGIRPLKAARNDARSLEEALNQYAGFPKSQIIVLASKSENEPTRFNIMSHLARLKGLVPKDGLFLLAFAGHGIEQNGKLYLMPSDTVADKTWLIESGIETGKIKDAIREIGAGQVIILLDACRTNSIDSPNFAEGRSISEDLSEASKIKPFDFDYQNREVIAFATLYATGQGFRAYENKDKKQGYFTGAFIEGLMGRAANEKGEVTLAALVKYVQQKVALDVLHDLGPSKIQRPDASIEGYLANELVFSMSKQNGSFAEVASERNRSITKIIPPLINVIDSAINIPSPKIGVPELTTHSLDVLPPPPAASLPSTGSNTKPMTTPRFCVVVSQKPVYSHQVRLLSPSFPAVWIEERWKEGYDITTLSGGKGKWLVVMSKGLGYTQSYGSVSSLDDQWIKQKLDEGYKITSVDGAMKDWLVVVSKKSKYGRQDFYLGQKFPTIWIQQKWREGFQITGVALKQKEWLIVMSKNSGYEGQAYRESVEPPDLWVKQRQAEGYNITSVAANEKALFMGELFRFCVNGDNQRFSLGRTKRLCQLHQSC
jgi:hypothetical protein